MTHSSTPEGAAVTPDPRALPGSINSAPTPGTSDPRPIGTVSIRHADGSSTEFTVSLINENRMITARVAEHVFVQLDPVGGVGWSAPAATAAEHDDLSFALTPLRRDDAGGAPAPSFASFTAIRTGEARISAVSDICRSTPACDAPQQRFTVTIVVQPAQPGGPAGPQPVPPQ